MPVQKPRPPVLSRPSALQGYSMASTISRPCRSSNAGGGSGGAGGGGAASGGGGAGGAGGSAGAQAPSAARASITKAGTRFPAPGRQAARIPDSFMDFAFGFGFSPRAQNREIFFYQSRGTL
jgi:hypothetical protein